MNVAPPSRSKPALRRRIARWRLRFRWVFWYRLTSPFRRLGRILTRFVTPYPTAILLALVAVLLLRTYKPNFEVLLPNVITDLFGVAITVLLIDTIYRVRSDSELKKVLVSKLGSKNGTVATEALKEIEARGWLHDGTLYKAFLLSASLDGNSFMGADMRRAHLSFSSLQQTTWLETDLQGAFFDYVDLRKAQFYMYSDGNLLQADISGASFANANLTGATFRDEQLCRARTLWRATMPDGTTYDGRYNLPQDIELFLSVPHNAADPLEWAAFYGVGPPEYAQGQSWAKENPSLSNPSVSA